MIESASIKDFLGRDVEILLNPAYLEQFTPVASSFGTIRTYLLEMVTAIDNSSSEDIKGLLFQYLNKWNSLHEQIKNYNAAQDATAQFVRSRGIIQSITRWYNAILNGYDRDNSTGQPQFIPDHFLSIYAFIKSSKSKVENLQAEAAAQLTMIQAHQADASRHHDEFVKYLEKVKEAVGDQAKEKGISKYGNLFDQEATRFKDLSTKWIWGAVVTLLLTIIATLLLWSLVDIKPDNTYDIVQFTVIKVLIVSGGFYALSVCMKNYRAHKHNEVLNKHRHNALTTFELFTSSTEDPLTKNSVLLAATQTIFGNQNTGYNNAETNDVDFPSKVIEYVRPSPERI